MGRLVKPIPIFSKSRAAKEKEEKQKEEEAAAREAEGPTASAGGEPQPFVAPGDNNLIQYMEDMQEKVSPLPTTRDQVIALAQSVLILTTPHHGCITKVS